MVDAGLPPDPWQAAVLRSTSPRVLMLTCRQAGKTTTAGFLALRESLLYPGSTVLVAAPSLRQAGELFRRTADGFNRLGRPVGVTAESALRVEFANGSRVVSVPASEANIRGFTAWCVILDEAARIPDALLAAVRPMLATTGGSLVCLSTAFAKQGFFHDAWTGSESWERVKVTARMCPRISPQFLAEERRVLGARWFAMEYEGCFQDSVASVFSGEDIRAAFDSTAEPLRVGRLFGGAATPDVVPASPPPASGPIFGRLA